MVNVCRCSQSHFASANANFDWISTGENQWSWFENLNSRRLEERKFWKVNYPLAVQVGVELERRKKKEKEKRKRNLTLTWDMWLVAMDKAGCCYSLCRFFSSTFTDSHLPAYHFSFAFPSKGSLQWLAYRFQRRPVETVI